MSIYLNKDSKIIVQGMTGGMGSKHTTLMLEAGSNIVGGVNARKAGTTGRARRQGAAGLRHRQGGDGRDRRRRVGRLRAAGVHQGRLHRGHRRRIGLLVVITEGVPVQDTAEVWAYLRGQDDPDDRPELPRHHHARRSRWPASRRTPSRARARSAWCRSRAR